MKEKNYITRAGFKRLTDELNWLNNVERPRVTREVGEAAAEGDRSENAAYIYGKRRLREIDRRMGFLQRRIDNAEPVDVKNLNQDKIRFGATVDVEDDAGVSHSFRIVGVDEVEVKAGKISWKSPIGAALLGKSLDDTVTVRIAAGGEEKRRELTIVDIRYEVVEEEAWKPNATAWRPPSHDARVANEEAAPRAPAETKPAPSGGTKGKKPRRKS
jgi:transcription elongation factor GreB